jgi:ParB family transcriptional regulator, chromosome partitioning protein
MSDLATPLLEVDRIEVVEGFNPRTRMDPDALARLAGSIGKTDVVQPLKVRPLEGGRFALIAGHRRLEAAKLAGIKKVPIDVRQNGTPRTVALTENLHREDLDAIDTARGLKELAAELNLSTNKKIAEELDLSESWVSQHLRLLKLPEGVQAYIAEGHVPIEAERDLRGIAKVSPRVAECICQLAKRRKVKAREFVVNFGELLAAVPHAGLGTSRR